MKSITTNATVSFTLFCFLLSIVSPVRYGWAAEPPVDPLPISAPDESFQPLMVNEAQGDTFVADLIDQMEALPGGKDEHVVSFLHIGDDADPKLIAMVRNLVAAGIEVKGTIVTEAEFDDAVTDYTRAIPDHQTIARYLLTHEGSQLPEQAKEEVRRRFSLGSILSRINQFKNRLFGLPGSGITFLCHFLKRNDEGNLERRFSSAGWGKMAAFTSVLAAASFSAIIIYKGMNPWSAGFVGSNILLTVWIFTFLLFTQEVNSFKMQGLHPYFDAKAPPGEQLVTSPDKASSQLFFSSSTVVQEWVFLALLLPILMGPSNVPILNAAINGFLSAFSYIFPKRLKGIFLKRAEQSTAVGATETAKRFNFIALVIAFSWWNLIYPVVKNAHLFFAGDMDSSSEVLAALPLIVLGTAGLIGEIALNGKRLWRSLTSFVRRLAFWKKKTPCPTLIAIQRK